MESATATTRSPIDATKSVTRRYPRAIVVGLVTLRETQARWWLRPRRGARLPSATPAADACFILVRSPLRASLRLFNAVLATIEVSQSHRPTAGAWGTRGRQFRRQGRIPQGSRGEPRRIEDFQPRARQLTSPADWKRVVPDGGVYSSFKRFAPRPPDSRPISRTTSGCRRSPASPSCRPTHCRRSPTRPKKSCAYSSIGGLASLSFATPIGLLIAALLGLVAFSYRQTIHAYPSGGGAYIVSKDNLGDRTPRSWPRRRC